MCAFFSRGLVGLHKIRRRLVTTEVRQSI